LRLVIPAAKSVQKGWSRAADAGTGKFRSACHPMGISTRREDFNACGVQADGPSSS
jgi:hypothetical protein